MPRAFTEIERQTIRTRLMEAGRSCFLRFGLTKTTIEDLTRPVGIAKASFYLFFDSKEDLFVEVFMEEMPAMMDRLLDASFHATDDVREALIRFMRAMVHELETNEFARLLLEDPSGLERLASSLDYARILLRATDFFAPLLEEIAQAQARGAIIAGDPLQVTYSMGVIKLLPVNRDRIPPEMYNALLDFVPQVLADGLTCPARTQKGGTQ
jgi:AcrR family transcriptional regulator